MLLLIYLWWICEFDFLITLLFSSLCALVRVHVCTHTYIYTGVPTCIVIFESTDAYFWKSEIKIAFAQYCCTNRILFYDNRNLNGLILALK